MKPETDNSEGMAYVQIGSAERYGYNATTAFSTLCKDSIKMQDAMGIQHVIKRSEEPPPY